MAEASEVPVGPFVSWMEAQEGGGQSERNLAVLLGIPQELLQAMRRLPGTTTVPAARLERALGQAGVRLAELYGEHPSVNPWGVIWPHQFDEDAMADLFLVDERQRPGQVEPPSEVRWDLALAVLVGSPDYTAALAGAERAAGEEG